jgi:hypothetical protein
MAETLKPWPITEDRSKYSVCPADIRMLVLATAVGLVPKAILARPSTFILTIEVLFWKAADWAAVEKVMACEAVGGREAIRPPPPALTPANSVMYIIDIEIP